MRKRYTAADRARLLGEVKATGETARVVAERLGVTPSTAYLWLKAERASAEKPVTPKFARVVREQEKQRAMVVVQVASVTIRVDVGFDAELLRSVVAALSEPA